MESVVPFEAHHDLPFPREAVWTALSNTDWFNRALGLPAVKYEFQARAEGGSTTLARARLAGLEIVWQELPFEWLEPEFYRVRRVVERGPLRSATVKLELLSQPGGTRVRITSEILPRNLLGKLLAERIVLPKPCADAEHD
jgi:hypothetical protein